MNEGSPNWIVMGPSASPAEEAALAAFRELLADDGETTAWANVTFVDSRGITAEVDVLLLSPVGIYCIELKGWHGSIEGNTQHWVVGEEVRRNPFITTDAKAKRLASLLRAQAETEQEARSVWVNALVVLHGQGSRVNLDSDARVGVLRLDGSDVAADPELTSLSEFLGKRPADSRNVIRADRAATVRRLCERANLVAVSARELPDEGNVQAYVAPPAMDVAPETGNQESALIHNRDSRAVVQRAGAIAVEESSYVAFAQVETRLVELVHAAVDRHLTAFEREELRDRVRLLRILADEVGDDEALERKIAAALLAAVDRHLTAFEREELRDRVRSLRALV